MILVTGGAGFIGSNFILDWLAQGGDPVLNLDLLTYAGSLDYLASLAGDQRHMFVHGDICDAALLARLLAQHRPRAIVHFAAETHVDRSIGDPALFANTNINGTLVLLEAARRHWDSLGHADKAAFRFLHVSTDEVYGALAPSAAAFTESSPYAPNSPYAASKAASDHLVRAWGNTYGLPVLTAHCSNNYGPHQFPEKLIPLVISNALAHRPLPLYGDGLQVRDWLYVADHCSALRAVLGKGRPGETYNVGGGGELANLEVVHSVCDVLDALAPKAGSYRDLVTHVADRPGHDRRYAVDAAKTRRELGWAPLESFESGLRKTVQWYLSRAEAI